MDKAPKPAGDSARSPSEDSLTLQLELAEERLHVVLGLTDGIVMEFDAEGRYLTVLTRSSELLAGPPETLLGRTISEVIGPQAATPFMERIQRVLATKRPEYFEYSLPVAKGVTWFRADALLVPQRPHVVFLIRDVSHQKQLELQLLQADRLAALGTLAAGVAHEVNNPLAYISSNLNFITEGVAESRRALSGAEGPPDLARLERTLEECADALAEAREGTERIRQVVGDLKMFARGEDVHPGEEQADVGRALEMSMNMAMPHLRNRARLTRQLEKVPPVRGNGVRLGQVFLNLLLNAAQAIPEGSQQEHTVGVHLRAEGDKVVVDIRDTGEGIPPENLKRLFEPFFSTKPAGVGTGLGLAVCHSIVTAMQGKITVESTVGKGTCFRVLLPAAPAG